MRREKERGKEKVKRNWKGKRRGMRREKERGKEKVKGTGKEREGE